MDLDGSGTSDVINVTRNSYTFVSVDGNIYSYLLLSGLSIFEGTDMPDLTLDQVQKMWLWGDITPFDLNDDKKSITVEISEGIVNMPISFSNEDNNMLLDTSAIPEDDAPDEQTWLRVEDNSIFDGAVEFPWRYTMNPDASDCM